jgi:hypothetical protein
MIMPVAYQAVLSTISAGLADKFNHLWYMVGNTPMLELHYHFQGKPGRIFVKPAESPTLSTGYKVGNHRIQGISDEFIPSIVKLDQIDHTLSVNDGDAIIMAQMLASQLGLAVGISSGANVIGAIRLHQKMGIDSIVATILPDSNKKYLSTDLMRAEPIREEYLSPEIQLIDYSPIPRTNSSLPDFLKESDC